MLRRNHIQPWLGKRREGGNGEAEMEEAAASSWWLQELLSMSQHKQPPAPIAAALDSQAYCSCPGAPTQGKHCRSSTLGDLLSSG